MERTKTKIRVSFKKPGLILSGGATKAAAFHIGVCLALRDKGFSFVGGVDRNAPPDNACPYPAPKYHPQQIATYVGSSAGALMCSMLSSGVAIESLINSFSSDIGLRIPGDFPEIRKIRYSDIFTLSIPGPRSIWRSFRRTSVLGRTLESMVLRNLRVPGVFSTRGLAQYLRKNVLPTDSFRELKPDLYVVGTQLDHSTKVIFGRYSTEASSDRYSRYSSLAGISDAVAASMSVPPIFTPYLIDYGNGKSRYYTDGEIRETLSTHVAKENGCDLILCSYTHQPYHYKEEIGSLADYGIAAIVIQSIYQSIEQKVYGARKAHENKVIALNTVKEFFREKKYPVEDLELLIGVLEQRLDFRVGLNYVFIHPEPKDREMFFGDHFTLSAQALQRVITIGYKRAMAELRRYELIPSLG